MALVNDFDTLAKFGQEVPMTDTDTFAVRRVAQCVRTLYKFTLFDLIRNRFQILPPSDYWIDLYGFIALVAAIGSYGLTFLFFRMPVLLEYWSYAVLTIIAAWRIYEIAVYQMKVLFVDHYEAGPSYMLLSYRRSLVLLGSNYVETVFWFSTIYSVFAHLGWIGFQVSAPAVLMIFRESVGMMVANATGNFDMKTATGFRTWFVWIAVAAHASIGLFMTLVILSRFVSLLPKPGTQDVNERSGSQQGL